MAGNQIHYKIRESERRRRAEAKRERKQQRRIEKRARKQPDSTNEGESSNGN